MVKSPKAMPWDVDCSHDQPITKQEFADEADVNKIVERCLRSGVRMPGPEVAPVFADATVVGDFGACMSRIRNAEEAFMTLDPKLRAEFDNSAVKLMRFLSDPDNTAKAVKLGLMVKGKPVEAPKAPVVPPPVAAAGEPAASAAV